MYINKYRLWPLSKEATCWLGNSGEKSWPASESGAKIYFLFLLLDPWRLSLAGGATDLAHLQARPLQPIPRET